jgi:hypothetical protein
MPDKAVQVRKQLAYRTEKGLRHFVTSGYRRRPSRFRVTVSQVLVNSIVGADRKLSHF